MTLCLQGIRSNHLSYIDKCTEWDLNPRSIRSRSWVYPLWPLGNLCINIHDGTRTRNPQIRSLVRYPITLHGQILTRVNRTPDKWIYSPLLYQLSYSEKKKVPPGLEPGSSDSKSEVLTITPRNLIILRKANTVEVWNQYN